jgi:hypothetical protein
MQFEGWMDYQKVANWLVSKESGLHPSLQEYTTGCKGKYLIDWHKVTNQTMEHEAMHACNIKLKTLVIDRLFHQSIGNNGQHVI